MTDPLFTMEGQMDLEVLESLDTDGGQLGKYRTRAACRLCGSSLKRVLDLPSTPPANEFLERDAAERGTSQDKFPLILFGCLRCGHIQLPVIVSPERLFRDYVYVSGTSPVFVDHFRRYAEEVRFRADLEDGDLVIDVGSNDGTLLRFFKDSGCRVLGVDPATEIALRTTADGILTLPEFFTPELAERIFSMHGRARVITANNVFAHADDLSSIANSVANLLTEDGLFVFEVSYLPDVVENTLFDTIYHEHLSYHHLAPLIPFFERRGLELFDARRVDTHGGSVRCYVGRPGRMASRGLAELLRQERDAGFSTEHMFLPFRHSPMRRLQTQIDDLKKELGAKLALYRADGKSVAAFGAPAKLTTLMYALGIDGETVDFVVDDSPLKQGKVTPGRMIPVVSSEVLYDRRPDYCLVTAWNFAEPIMKKHERYREEGGTFIVPIPEIAEYGPP